MRKYTYEQAMGQQNIWHIVVNMVKLNMIAGARLIHIFIIIIVSAVENTINYGCMNYFCYISYHFSYLLKRNGSWYNTTGFVWIHVSSCVLDEWRHNSWVPAPVLREATDV